MRANESGKSQSRCKWTILIYFAGDNNLAEECVYALKEMKEIGSQNSRSAARKMPPKFNVIAQFDPSGRGNPTRRFKITGPGGDGSLESDVTKELPETDTGYWRTLLNFLCDSIEDEENQADYYMVVLSGHAAGPAEGFFLQDEERALSSIPISFPIPKLRSVFGSDRLKTALKGKKINIVGFDACMMSTVEVCYELRDMDILDLVIAAEGFTLNSGWPFARLISKLNATPSIPPPELADFVVKDYVKFYYDYFLGGLSADQTAIRLDRIGELKDEIDKLAKALIEEFKNDVRKGNKGIENKGYDDQGKPFQDAILLAHWAAQSYNGEQCVDLFDFCHLLQKRWHHDQSANSVWACCRRVKEVIRRDRNPLILRSCFTGAAFEYSYGVSLYFPWASYDNAPSYKKLAFAKDSYWPDFLRVYLGATQRPPRVETIKVRLTPPTNRGPGGKIHSMRNPPTGFPLSNCIRDEDWPDPKV
jgi:hypothetical protein